MNNSPSNTSLSYVIRNGMATSAMDTFAVGPTLIAYAKLLGAGNIAFGVLGSIPYFGNLLHLFAAWLLMKGYSVRRTALTAAFISRPFYLLIAFLAFASGVFAVPLLIFFLCCCYFIGCISGGCWMPWMKALIPEKIMGEFFARRFKWMQIVKVICLFGTILLLRYVHSYYPDDEIYAYSFLFSLAFVFGMYGVYTFSKIEDKKIKVYNKISFFKQFFVALSLKSFRSLLIVLCVLNFGFSFMVPFITVFMLNQLSISSSMVLFLFFVSQVSYIFVIKKMGNLSDELGCYSVFFIFILLFVFLSLGFCAVNYLSCSLIVIEGILFVLHLVLGFAIAAFNLGINNASLLYVPKSLSIVCLSVNSIFKSAAGAFGALSAGGVLVFATALESWSKSFFGTYAISAWTTFFVVAICIELFGLFLLRLFQKNVVSVS